MRQPPELEVQDLEKIVMESFTSPGHNNTRQFFVGSPLTLNYSFEKVDLEKSIPYCLVESLKFRFITALFQHIGNYLIVRYTINDPDLP